MDKFTSFIEKDAEPIIKVDSKQQITTGNIQRLHGSTSSNNHQFLVLFDCKLPYYSMDNNADKHRLS